MEFANDVKLLRAHLMLLRMQDYRIMKAFIALNAVFHLSGFKVVDAKRLGHSMRHEYAVFHVSGFKVVD
jgi:hypothetical protein